MENAILTLTPGDKVIVKQASQRHNTPRFHCGIDSRHAIFLRMDKRGRYVVQFGSKTRRLRLHDILVHETRRANFIEGRAVVKALNNAAAMDATTAKDDTPALVARLNRWAGK